MTGSKANQFQQVMKSYEQATFLPVSQVLSESTWNNWSCRGWDTEEWVSEQILNGTSAQLVPFTLVHTGKYRTEDKSKTDTTKTKLKTTPKK